MGIRRGRNPYLVRNGERIIGVNLGWDFCAEHEWGIEKTKTALGIKGGRITKFNKELFFFEKRKTHSCFVFSIYGHGEELAWRNPELDSQTKEIAAAWCDGAFGIIVSNEYGEFLAELYNAFKKRNAAIYLGRDSDNPFAGAGLLILIASKIPKEMKLNKI
ncbi:MAG: hypothetical protein HYW70_01415 [Candidatus Nealsonbacteria bacterium]|nr:hypothetical protein [Candidatus Nealsonbacteria bacterium]